VDPSDTNKSTSKHGWIAEPIIGLHRDEIRTMKNPSKTAAEHEASKVEMEDSWKVTVITKDQETTQIAVK
jgi:hypothetical protein